VHAPGWADEKAARHRAHQRLYGKSPEGRATARRSRLNNQRAELDRNARWKAANRDAANAHERVRGAVRSGILERNPCLVCGDPAVEAHHPRGYAGAAALDVEWLCKAHHGEVHGRAST